MKIRVNVNILAGNMGDGWADQYEAAVGYGYFLKPRIEEEILNKYPNANIDVSMDVDRESGCRRDTMIIVDGVDDDSEWDITHKLEEAVADIENEAWDDFCCSPEAEQYAA